MGTVIKKYPIERMNLSINMEKTGAHIKRTLKGSGYTMREIMEITGVTSEQAIYKWYSGKSIPSLETQIILCKLLGIKITELLVIDGEFDFFPVLNCRLSDRQARRRYTCFCEKEKKRKIKSKGEAR